MHVYYCKKCKQDSLSQVCDRCGASITAPNERFKWRTIRTPLGDAPMLFGILKALTLTTVALLLFLFLGELIFSPNKQAALTMFSTSGLVPGIMIFLFLCAALICLVLGLQGQEELHYVVDARGAHMQTWIVPSRIKCLSRAIPYDACNIVSDAEGNQRMLINETHLMWNEVCRCEFRRHACRIDLYRPASFRFISLYPEREEQQDIEDYMKNKMKQLVKNR